MGRGKLENERRGCVALESCRWACRTLVGLVRDAKVGLANLHVITEGGVGGINRDCLWNDLQYCVGGVRWCVKRKREKEREREKKGGGKESTAFPSVCQVRNRRQIGHFTMQTRSVLWTALFPFRAYGCINLTKNQANQDQTRHLGYPERPLRWLQPILASRIFLPRRSS
jgi:hypothetical protein